VLVIGRLLVRGRALSRYSYRYYKVYLQITTIPENTCAEEEEIS